MGGSDGIDKGDNAEHRGLLAVFNKEVAAAKTATSETVMCCTAKHKGNCAKEGGTGKGSSAADKDLAACKDDVSIASGADSGGSTIDEGGSNPMHCRPMRNAESLDTHRSHAQLHYARRSCMHLHVCLHHGTAANKATAVTSCTSHATECDVLPPRQRQHTHQRGSSIVAMEARRLSAQEDSSAPGIDNDTKTTAHDHQAKKCGVLCPVRAQ